MKALVAVGLVLVILGIASLFVPIPQNDRAGVEIGGVSLGIETSHKEKVSPIVSAVLILAGAGMMIAGQRKKA
jgi:hypothetical protein